MPSDTGVTLVLGPPNSGKRGLVLEWWQERLPRRPVVVMPTGPDAEDMSAEMARRLGGLVGQSSAVTFAGLVQLILGRPCRYAADFERTLLVSQLLRGTALEALGGAVHLPGVTSALSALLLELGESGRTPEEIDAVLEQWALRPREPVTVCYGQEDIPRLENDLEQAVAGLRRGDFPTRAGEACGHCSVARVCASMARA